MWDPQLVFCIENFRTLTLALPSFRKNNISETCDLTESMIKIILNSLKKRDKKI